MSNDLLANSLEYKADEKIKILSLATFPRTYKNQKGWVHPPLCKISYRCNLGAILSQKNGFWYN